MFIAAGERLRDRRLDVAVIVRHDAELLGEMLGKTGVADRRRPHVDAAAALPEIQRGADQRHLAARRLHAHGGKANVNLLADMPDGVPAAPVRVLLADDDRAFLDSLRPLIERQPELTVVGTAENGLDAIEQADALAPDAVVIDLHMPLVDGVTAVARLRKDHPNLCLIAVTGDPDRQLHEAVAEAGADAVLEKVALVDTLVERLAAVRARPQPGRLAGASGEVAQLVEHSAENRGVAGSSPALAITPESPAPATRVAMTTFTAGSGRGWAAPAHVGRGDEGKARSLRTSRRTASAPSARRFRFGPSFRP